MKSQLIVQIDDDEDDCTFFKEAVSELGLESYKSFQNPEEALHSLAEASVVPMIIILDINMRGMNGFEFLEQLDKINICQNVPIYMFSTNSFPSGNAIDSRVTDFINKPACFIKLKKIISQILEKHNIL